MEQIHRIPRKPVPVRYNALQQSSEDLPCHFGRIVVREQTEVQYDNDRLLVNDKSNHLPKPDESSETRRASIIALILAAVCCMPCFIISGMIFGAKLGPVLYRTRMGLRTAEVLSFIINVVLTQCLEGMGYIHSISLRWVLYQEERLQFNTNLRLFTSSKRSGPNKWYINMVSGILQIFSYAATSLLFMDNNYPGDPYAYVNPIALLALGLSLAGQIAIATWCLQLTGLSLPSWSSNPLNTTLVALRGHMQRRTNRCMRSVDQIALASEPSLPKDRQRALFYVVPTIRWLLGFIWGLVVLAVAWVIAVTFITKSVVAREQYDTGPWYFHFNWFVVDDADGFDLGINDVGLSTGYNTAAAAQLLTAILFVFAVQGLQTLGLHCTEILVNMWRDEGVWRAASIHGYEGHASSKQKKTGARLKTGAVSSAISSGPYLVLFLMKALLHWLLGQSISPSVNVAPISRAGLNMPTFVENSPDVIGYKLASITFNMIYLRLVVFATVTIAFAIFLTILIFWRPGGPQPVTWGHLQTLADLIDDWNVDEDGNMWWGDKGFHRVGVRHAGTGPNKLELENIVDNAFYQGG